MPSTVQFDFQMLTWINFSNWLKIHQVDWSTSLLISYYFMLSKNYSFELLFIYLNYYLFIWIIIYLLLQYYITCDY